MFLNRKKYFESIGKIEAEEVFLDLKTKKVKFLINKNDLENFTNFKNFFESEFLKIFDNNPDFSPEQNLIAILYKIFNEKEKLDFSENKENSPSAKESPQIHTNSFNEEAKQTLWNESEIKQSFIAVLKEII